MGAEISDYHLELIQAAGGLVWRDKPEGRRLAVVHRTKYKDWTLPKGKLEENEDWLTAARREVKEETGSQVHIDGFAGSICYTSNGKSKIVRFWHMSVVGIPETTRAKDVDKVEWLSVTEACERIQYPLEKALIESAEPPDAPSDFILLRWWHSLWKSDSYHRLACSLPIYRIELQHLIKAAQKSEKTSDWPVSALSLLEQSEKALSENNAELGWRCFNAAKRMELYGISKEALKARAQSLLREAQEKLSSWRKEAIINLLNENGTFNENVLADKVVCAAQILHEHQDNVYQRLMIFKYQLLILSIAAALSITFWIILVSAKNTAFSSLNTMLPVPPFAVVLFGIMGAAVSGILTTVSNPAKARIPDQLTAMSITLARLVIGAATALAIAVFLLSGILILAAQISPALLLATAFASGFSERLIMRAIEQVAK